MAETKFKIHQDAIETSTSTLKYSDYESYYTLRYEGGTLTAEGYVCYNRPGTYKDILKTEAEVISWRNTVQEYLYDHNSKVKSGDLGVDIKYVMTDMDSRFAFSYEKYINGKVVETGLGFYKDLKTDTERDAWIDAAIKYKKENGIDCDTSNLQALVDQIKDSIKSLDAELPELNLTDIPLIELALEKLIEDPCQFIPAVMKAGAVNISRINGIPNPTEIANYLIKLLKDNAERAITIVTRTQAPIVDAVTEPLTDYTELEMIEHFRKLDAQHEEFMKQYSQMYTEFEVCEYQYEYGNGSLVFEQQDGDLYTGIDDGDYGDALYEEPDYETTFFTFDDMTVWSPKKDGNGNTIVNELPPPEYISNHIKEFIKDFLNPIRAAWGVYAKQKGWNPEWRITSGYRSPAYNAVIGGVSNSVHKTGYAADIQPKYFREWDAKDLADFIYEYCKQHNIKFDRMLREIRVRADGTVGTWIHMGYKDGAGNQKGFYKPYFYDSRSKDVDPEKQKITLWL